MFRVDVPVVGVAPQKNYISVYISLAGDFRRRGRVGARVRSKELQYWAD